MEPDGPASALWARHDARRKSRRSENWSAFTVSDVKKIPREAERESVAEIPLLHSIDGACRRLSMGRSWLYAEIAAGRIRVAKLGRRTLIPDEELRRVAGEAVQS